MLKWVGKNRQSLATVIGFLIAAGVLISIVTAVLTAICGSVIPLPDGETCAQCVRAWIGSLSGWVAAIAAFATLIYLRQTLEASQESNKILEEQTRAVTGNLDPVFNYSGIDKNGQQLFRFWNNNRRSITVDLIKMIEPKDANFSITNSSNVQYQDKDHGKYDNISKTQDLTCRIVGTPIGERCEEPTFHLVFYDRSNEQIPMPDDLKLEIVWRYRDDDRWKKKTMTWPSPAQLSG